MRDDELNRIVGAELRRRRKARGLKLREVVDGSGIKLPHLSDIERGSTACSLAVLRRVCAKLGVTLSELLAGVPESWGMP